MSGFDQNSDFHGSGQYAGQSVNYPSSPNDDEWYDQGFDLSDENDIDSGISQDYAINLNRVKSASEQFSTADRDPQRAQMSDLNVSDPSLVAVPEPKIEAKQATIYVGGYGQMPESTNDNRSYQFSQQARQHKADRVVPAEPEIAYEDDSDSEFGTGSRNPRHSGLSAEDARFLRAARFNDEAEIPHERTLKAFHAASQAAHDSDVRLASQSNRSFAHMTKNVQSLRRNDDYQSNSGEAYLAMQASARAARESDARLAGGHHQSMSAKDAAFLHALRQKEQHDNTDQHQSYHAMQAAARAARDSDARLAAQARSLSPHDSGLAMRNNEEQEAQTEVAFNAFQAAAMAAKQSDARLAAQSHHSHSGTPTEAAYNAFQAAAFANRQDAKATARSNAPAAHANAYLAAQAQGFANGTEHLIAPKNPPQAQQMTQRHGNDYNFMSASLEAANSDHSVRPRDPTDTNANSSKSLEELAREYPELSPEDLVKLRRSSNRCHLVTRIPVYDVHSNIAIYELKFTSGRVFQINSLKSQHVYHVLFGYFIRRGISCFIGKNKLVMVMMPITYDLINYIDRFSANRLILRISPDQPVTPSALHLLTSLKRSGMRFAIDIMLLLKKDWNKAILSLEYVMIDLSTKVREQINVFQRIKSKAPWLKTIGYNDVNHDGYTLLANHLIDYLDAPFWCPKLNFNQDISAFYAAQDQALSMINVMFSDHPNYQIFLRFLSHNETVSRNMAIFLYRFRHVSPRQIQNIKDLYNCLIENSANRSFSVVIGYSLLQMYCRSAGITTQSVLQEYYAQALIRGYFVEYMAKVFEDQSIERYAFQAGMFSLLHLFLLREEVEVLIDEQFETIINRIYGENELLSDIVDCAKALEAMDLVAVFKFIQKYQLPPASVLVSYEKGIMRTNELLLVLSLVPNRT